MKQLSTNTLVLIHADDVTIEVTGNSLVDFGNKANDLLRNLDGYSIDSLFSISIAKRAFMIQSGYSYTV